MVRPSGFKTNIQTLENNFFQNISNLNENELLEKAQQEFDNLVNKIRSNGIPIIVFQDDHKHETPDSLFPNNWISLERSFELIKFIEKNGVIINNIYDYTEAENNNEFLEGTGSMVLDRINNKAYASISERTSENLVDEFCEDFDYMPIIFKSFQSHNNKRKLIYHTNVMMCIASKYCVICLDAIDDEVEKNKVIQSLNDDKKEIINIDNQQLNSFAGNMIELIFDNKSYLIMSSSAYSSLSAQQINNIEKYSQIIYSDVSTIEYCGGGSVRCMIAEIFN